MKRPILTPAPSAVLRFLTAVNGFCDYSSSAPFHSVSPARPQVASFAYPAAAATPTPSVPAPGCFRSAFVRSHITPSLIRHFSHQRCS